MLNERIAELKIERCEGCAIAAGGQNSHTCLTHEKSTSEYWLEEKIANVCCFEFVARLAKRGQERRIVVSEPMQAYMWCSEFRHGLLSSKLLHG